MRALPRPLLLAAVVLATNLWPTPTPAQSDPLREAYDQYRALDAQGRYAEAIPHARKAVALGERKFGPDHPTTAVFLNNLAVLYDDQGRYAEAEPLHERALAIREKALGPDHPDVGQSLNNLAQLYRAQGRYADAEPLYKRALAIDEKALGPEHPYVATTLINLAALYHTQARYAEVEPLYRRALAIREKSLGPEHPEVASSLNNLAELYRDQGRYAEAGPLYKRALAIWEQALGPEHPEVATGLNNLAALYEAQGRYAEAEPLYKRALAIDEKALGPEHPDVATSLNNLAELYESQGRYAEAEPLHERALAIREKALGPEHPDVAISLNNLAGLYHFQGLYAEAEPLYKRALAIKEKALGPEHPSVATSLNNLAELYRAQGRTAEAEPLYQRSLAIKEKALGPDHPRVATALNNLALIYEAQGRTAEAAPLHKRSLAIREKALGPEHPSVAASLNNLALLYEAQVRTAEAEPLYKRALAIVEKALGPEHPDVATSLNNLAELYESQGRYAEAEPLYPRSLAIKEKALGLDHPDLALGLNNLAALYEDQGRYAEALTRVRRATDIHRVRAARAGGQRSGGGLKERKTVRPIFLHHVDIATRLLEEEPDRTASLLAEAFEAGQLARATSAGAAVARMAARFAAGDDALARLVRERQDGIEAWQRLDRALVEAVSRPPGERHAETEARYRTELAALDDRLGALEDELGRSFPEYAELASPRPVALGEIQILLAPDEALLAYLVWDETTFLFVLRADRAAVHRLPIGEEEIEEAVVALRAGLDPTGVRRLDDIPAFDAAKAHALYRRLVAPAAPLLDGVGHLLVVPDGALQSLPPGVLLTAAVAAGDRGVADYRDLPWLARKYAITTLPSVGALRALRRFAHASGAAQPFVGFGDPLLEGGGESGRGIALADLFGRGALADVGAVRRLPRLPETADELAALAAALGAGPDAVYLRERATEARLRAMPLDRYRTIAFATHGLLAGELSGAAEPALVLSPPAEGTEADDGLLTASEIATLTLDADWVILSACNTAAADGTPGAEGLSGLAKAFFYAGSRALLVSHWPVVSDAAVALTTGAFRAMAQDPGIGRAAALRLSRLAMMADPARPHLAHPLFWGPFVVVGEGGAPPPG